MSNLKGQLTTVADMMTFAMAGNATLTLVSQKTGARYTFRLRKPKQTEATCPYFVSVMYGPDNENSFSYLGCIYPDKTYRHGKKSAMAEGDIRERAFRFFWDHVNAGRTPPQMEVWHEGKCCRCGRKLTVPASISNGIGPECVKHLGADLFSCEAA